MSAQPVRIPGPEHPIAITRNAKRVVVMVDGRVIADSRQALSLQEASYPSVYYLPRSDVDMTSLQRSDHRSYCPYKGEASYYSIPAGGKRSENAIWTYEAPHDAVSEIKDYVAFYPDRVDSIVQTAD
jgi:uncharacterized protein (DUF427 family)